MSANHEAVALRAATTIMELIDKPLEGGNTQRKAAVQIAVLEALTEVARAGAEAANQCINEAIAASAAKVAELTACIAKLQDSLVNAKKALLAYEEAPGHSAEMRKVLIEAATDCGHHIAKDFVKFERDPSTPGNALSQLATRLLDALAATPAQPAADVSAPTDERAITAAMAEANKENVKSTVAARIVAAYLNAARAAAPVSGPSDALTYTVDGVRMSPLEYISHLHGLLQKAALVSGQAPSELLLAIRQYGSNCAQNQAWSTAGKQVSQEALDRVDVEKAFRKCADLIDSRPRSEDSRAAIRNAVLEEVAEWYSLETWLLNVEGTKAAIRALASTTPPKADNE
jgi:hypothetical protein